MIGEVGDVTHVNIHIVCGSSTDSASVDPQHRFPYSTDFRKVWFEPGLR
jgi:hypothetical protein